MRMPFHFSSSPVIGVGLGALIVGFSAFDRAEAAGPERVLLWPNGAPGAVGDEESDQPAIRIYQPKNPVGTAVVICPGGGYGILATDHEGHQVAKAFNQIGVTGVVLRYRHAPKYRHPIPLGDVQRAIRYVRSHAKRLKVSTSRIGVMGFSAGGHLASTAATHFDSGDETAKDVIDRVGCRPNFAILGYPVISMTQPFRHAGSKRNLLGNKPSEELSKFVSSELQVTSDTPPTFLFHTGEDRGVPVENSLAFYQALLKAKVPAELHVYQFGPHGVGLGIGDPVLFSWKKRLADWLLTSGFLNDVKRAEASGTITVNGLPLRWGTITFIPDDPKTMPTSWSMVSRGKYRVPAVRGVVHGKNKVVIRSLGSVEPQPTIEDVEELPHSGIVVRVAEGTNTFDFDLNGD